MAESQREAISLALNSTKLNAANSLFREDPSLEFSIVTEARDQTLPGSLLARETLGTRLESSVSLAVRVYSINSNFSNFGNSVNFEKQTPIFGKTKPDARKNQLRF